MNNPYQGTQYRSLHQDQRYPPPNYQLHNSQSGQQPITGQVRAPNNQFPIQRSPTQSAHNAQINVQAPQQQYPATQPNLPIYFPPPQNVPNVNGLISAPPQLKQQPRDSASQLIKQSKSKPNNQSDMRDIVWGQQQQTNTFWEQKFFMIYEKFQWFGQRFQMIKAEYYTLSQRLQTVDSQDDWNQLKRFHEEFGEKLQEMFQELIAVADQNQQLINQRLGEEGQGVWERRYHQLLSNFKALQEQINQLTAQIQHLRSQGGGNNQQNQNYQQLLSHYRTLQEQYDKLGNMFSNVKAQNQNILKTQNGNNSMIPSMQDFQNMRNEYQKNLQLMQGQYDHLKGQCQMLYEEKEHFREQIMNQGPSVEEVQHLNQLLKEKQMQISQIYGELTEYKKRYNELEILQKEEFLQSHQQQQSITKQKQIQIESLKHQLQLKSQQSKQLRIKFQDQLKTRQKVTFQHQQQIQRLVKIQNQKSSRQRTILEQQLKTLKQQLQNLHKKHSQKDLSKYQIQSYENKVKFFKEENDQLNQQIKNKNMELISLRNISLQLATYENVLEQYKGLEKEKLQMEQISRREHYELLSVRKRLTDVEHEFEEYKKYSSTSLNKTSSTSQLKQLQQQLNQQKEHSAKVTSQANKYKQIVQSKDNYSKELQNQNIKLLIKLDHQSRISQTQKIQYQSQITQLQRRIQTLQKRNRSNQLEFKKQITQNYEKQIKELRRFNEQKIKKIKLLQQQLHVFKSKSTHLQKSHLSHHKQYDLLKKKTESYQHKSTDLLAKLQLNKNTIHSLQQQLSSMKQKQLLLKTQLNSYMIQIEEADNLIKNKNQIINEYEKQVNGFIEKVGGLEKKVDEDKKYRMERAKQYEDEIEKLKNKLYGGQEQQYGSSKDFGSVRDTGNFYSSSYNNRYTSSYNSSRNLTFGTKQPNFTQQNLYTKNQQITKLQNNIIQQLNQQNNKLRNQVLKITKKLNEVQTLSRVLPTMMEESIVKNQPSKSKMSNVNINVPERDVPATQIEQRLMKFNQRLEHCIQDNQVLSMGGAVDLTASQRIAYHERQRRQMEIRHQKQIKSLIQKITALQNRISSLNSLAQSVQKQAKDLNNNNRLSQSQIKQFGRYQIMAQHAQKTAQQELQFLRTKLAQQTKTNSSLIKLNQQIKKQLQQYLQMNKFSTAQYYKLQWKQTEKYLLEQKQKNKKLTQENKKVKHENLEHDTKLAKQYELKLFNLEMKLTQAQRQISYLSANKTKGQNQRANLMHDINVYSADVQAIKNNMQTKISHYQKLNEQLKQKCQDYESHVNQLSFKLKQNSSLDKHSNVHGNIQFSNHNSQSYISHTVKA